MRDVFVSDLVKDLLGPKNGAREELDHLHNPANEYITGILSSRHDAQEETIAQNRGIERMDVDGSKADEDADVISDETHGYNPSLNPDKIPSSMGISFQIESNGDPELDVCVTWARYVSNSKDPNTITKWTRFPKFAILKISGTDDCKYAFDAEGKKCQASEAEVELTYRIKPLTSLNHLTHDEPVGGNRFFVSIFMTNENQVNEENKAILFQLFQPQIRIVCSGNTRLIPMLGADGDDMEEMQYRNKPPFARGHMTSAVWWEVDPENLTDVDKVQFGEAAKHAPFHWTDGEVLPDVHSELFSKPHLRTEYIPIYSIPSPDVNWSKGLPNTPVLDALKYSECWESTKLKAYLSPICLEYEKWIESLSKVKNGRNDKLVDKIIGRCNVALSRINDGIEKLLVDEDARLAFCFANKAIDIQSSWERKSPLQYRPFQMAFILMSLESILNSGSKHRQTCDLLWVPTGAGKTEAYLVLVAMAMAYRRLSEIKKKRSGAGVSVMTRYTLRLLTIQQFRRSLSLFCAAELLRTQNVAAGLEVGWRPTGYDRSKNLIWGTTPFSVGLWVGAGVTPNKLDTTRYPPRFVPTYGALDLLRMEPGMTGEGEPAQILNCPACGSILAIPEMGLKSGKGHQINWVVKTDIGNQDLPQIGAIQSSDYTIVKIEIKDIGNGYKILSVFFTAQSDMKPPVIRDLFNSINQKGSTIGRKISLQCVSAPRPGYFYKTYKSSRTGEEKEFDFQIFCPGTECPLTSHWVGGYPMGGIDGSDPLSKCPDQIGGLICTDGNSFVQAPKYFSISPYVSSRIPIPGFTVDQQVYQKAPTMIIATVDKFARLPYEPLAGILFGNAEDYHLLYGYRRFVRQSDTRALWNKCHMKINESKALLPPDFIIQDELHLLEGPLGTMVGMYESCIDYLCRKNVKYIASTATIKRGEEQVKSIFVRDLQIFPPQGTDVADRFFIREIVRHPIHDAESGRLYVGILAPGKGALTPIARIWARLAQTGYDNRSSPDIDRFWTITSYFNAVRELAGARTLYKIDIPDRLRSLSQNPRPLLEEPLELSGRTQSADLPSILEMLQTKYPEAVDGLFTTSMFGTGVDISRIGVMMVAGQPKTTYSYIQSTGRVGRSKGGLVPVFFRASRARDLSHYEYFIRNHMQLHRNVESPTVFPFSSGAVERALGPVIVGMLRNCINTSVPWLLENSAPLMANGNTVKNQEILDIERYLERRSQSQPDMRRLDPDIVLDKAKSCVERWRSIAIDRSDLLYIEYLGNEHSVVLGDLMHQMNQNIDTVFPNAPQSLRELEEGTNFKA